MTPPDRPEAPRDPDRRVAEFGFEQAVEAIATESGRLAAAVMNSDLDAMVPSTPQWSVRDLAHHIGTVQTFWAGNVTDQNPDQLTGRASTPFPEDSDLQAWLGSCTYSLLRALRDAGPDAPCWTFWPAPKTSGAVARHQAQEVAVHRWDADLAATGTPGPLPADVAADGVPEFIEIMIGSGAAALTGEVTLTAADSGDSWRVGSSQTPGHAARKAEVQATASDLVLILYRRLTLPDEMVDGDPILVASLLSLANTS
jgi:uncharacterized protein (TIGR03083 family)